MMETNCFNAFVDGRSEEGLLLLKDIKDPTKLKDRYGNTPLHFAAEHGWCDVVELLVNEYKFDVNSRNVTNETPVHWASLAGRLDVVKYFCNTGKCDLSVKSDFGHTPLDAARYNKHQEIVEFINEVLIINLAMKEGGGKMKPCNAILHGPPGVGKSSLKRVILGQSPLPEDQQNATHIIEKAARAVSTDRFATNGRKILAEVDNTDILKMLAKKAKSLRLNSHKPQQHDSTHHHTPESQHPVESVSNSPLNTSNSITLESIREQLADQVEPSSVIFDVDWMHLTDSGGQPQFLDVLPLLYRSKSLHIVVTRLDEGLDDKPKIRFYHKGEDVYTLPDRLTLTNREFIERACQIAEAQAIPGKFMSSVMVVGTHKDYLDKLGIVGEVKLKEINRELRKVHQKYNRVLICKSKHEVIFAVNAMAPVGEERQHYTEELQDCILKEAQKTGEAIDVPLKWLAFHLDLDKTGGIVRKSECYKTGEILGMGRSDVEKALKYFNKVGVLFHNPDDVPDLVFTEMDPLISRVSRLITASFITPVRCVTAPYDRLREKGLFNKSFLPTIFEDLYKSREEFADDDFLNVLESLKIGVHIGDNDYFLPSVLPFEPPIDDPPFPMSCVPLVFTWDEQILPHGFFLTFVVELLHQKGVRDNIHFELKKDVLQCRYMIQVTVSKNKIPGFLKLIDRKRWIEICYFCSRMGTKYCPQLLEITSDAVERVVKRFEHTGMKSHQIGFRCVLCDTDDHYCLLSHDYSMVSCSKHDAPVTPEMSCWIGKFDCKTPLTGDDLVSVLRATVEVADWYFLGLELDIPYYLLNEIKCGGYDETDCKKKMILRWLNAGQASWSSLAKALKSPLINKKRVAEQIIRDHS